MHATFSVVVLGATGAVGSQAVQALVEMRSVERLTLLGRRPLEGITSATSSPTIEQHRADIFDPASYRSVLPGHDVAICTLGVGQPSKVSQEEFIRIDRDAVLDFARECKTAGVRHFQLLASVGASSDSRSFYLRTKGELEDRLTALQFDRLSLFHPSMILTPTNRYGLSQAITLKVWPLLGPLLVGPLSKFRGIRVERLGRAFAANTATAQQGIETLEWKEIQALSN